MTTMTVELARERWEEALHHRAIAEHNCDWDGWAFWRDRTTERHEQFLDAVARMREARGATA
jgi:hypothetical protein